RAFGQAKLDSLPAYCRACEVRFACHGECPKHRFVKTPDGEDGLNYLCQAYRPYFNHIDPYMKAMVQLLQQRQPPAAVMELIKAGRLPDPARKPPKKTKKRAKARR
ncbi:MAG: SPASM domain-containing protein, partial [Planctomycetota bacterium]